MHYAKRVCSIVTAIFCISSMLGYAPIGMTAEASLSESEDELAQIMEQADLHRSAGRYEDALKTYEAALRIVEQGSGRYSDTWIWVQEDVAATFIQMKDYDAARCLLLQMQEIQEEQGAHYFYRSTVYLLLAKAYALLNDYQNAEKTLMKIMSHYDKGIIYGANPNERFIFMANTMRTDEEDPIPPVDRDALENLTAKRKLADLYDEDLKRYDEALKIYEYLLKAYKRTEDNPEYSQFPVARRMGYIHMRLERYADAVAVFQENLDRAKLVQDRHPEAIFDTLDDLAYANDKLGNHDKAAQLYEELVELRYGESGIFDDKTVAVLDNLLVLYADFEKWAELRKVLQKALGWIEAFPDTPHEKELAYRQLLVIAYESLHEDEKAIDEEVKIVHLLATVNRPDKNEELFSRRFKLALHYNKTGQFAAEAEQLAAMLDIEESPASLDADLMILMRLRQAQAFHKSGQHAASSTVLSILLPLFDEHPGLGTVEDLPYLYMLEAADLYAGLKEFAATEVLCVKILQKHPDKGSEAYDGAMRLLAHAHRAGGRYEEAERLYSQHIDMLISRKGEDAPVVINALTDLAYTVRERGDLGRAEGLYMRALTKAQAQHGDDSPESNAIRQELALIYKLRGNYSASKILFERCLLFYNQNNQEQTYPRMMLLHNYAALLQTLGDTTEAKQMYDEAYEWFSKNMGPDSHSALLVQRSLGILHRKLENREEARTAFETAEEGFTRLYSPEHPLVLSVRHELGSLYDDLEMAARHYRELAAIWERVEPENQNAMATLNALANVCMDMEQHAEARVHLEQCIVHLARRGEWDNPENAAVFHNLASVHQNLGHGGAAILYEKLAVNLVEKTLGDSEISQEQRKRYLENHGLFFSRLVSLLHMAGRPEEAQNTLLSKTRYERDYAYALPVHHFSQDMLDDMKQYGATDDGGWSENTPREQLRAALHTEEERLMEQFFSLCGAVAGLAMPAGEGEPGHRQNVLGQEERMLRDYLATLPETTAKNCIASLMDTRRFESWWSLQNTLRKVDPHAAVLFSVTTDNDIYLFLTTPTRTYGRDLPLPRKRVEETIWQLSAKTREPSSDAIPDAHLLYNGLLRNFAPVLEEHGIETILFFLDGPLRHIAPAALHDGKRWLVESYNTVVLTDLGITALNVPFPEHPRIIAFGIEELAAADAELTAIVREEGEKGGVVPGKRVMGASFTSTALREAFDSGVSVVHVTSHFNHNSEQPQASYLQLGDGGKLTMADFERVDMSGVYLLTLYACSTASTTRGEASAYADLSRLDTLADKALAQGAKSVLAARWPVADSAAAVLGPEFYRLRFSEGRNKADALRQAQLLLLNGGPGRSATFAHPHYWAPFLLMGNWQ